jgi:hypothetical protein
MMSTPSNAVCLGILASKPRLNGGIRIRFACDGNGKDAGFEMSFEMSGLGCCQVTCSCREMRCVAKTGAHVAGAGGSASPVIRRDASLLIAPLDDGPRRGDWVSLTFSSVLLVHDGARSLDS